MSCIEDLCARCEWKACKHRTITRALRNLDVWHVHARAHKHTQMRMCPYMYGNCRMHCTCNNKLSHWRRNGTVPTTLFALYSYTENICLPWLSPDTPNYLSSIFTYFYNPMYVEIHLCQNSLTMFYASFWVIPWRLNFVCQCFGTCCLFHLHRRVGTCLWRWNRQCVPKRRHIKFGCQGIIQKKAYNIQNMAKVWNQEYPNHLCTTISTWIISNHVCIPHTISQLRADIWNCAVTS